MKRHRLSERESTVLGEVKRPNARIDQKLRYREEGVESPDLPAQVFCLLSGHNRAGNRFKRKPLTVSQAPPRRLVLLRTSESFSVVLP